MVHLTTTLAHASGEWIASDWPVCPVAGAKEKKTADELADIIMSEIRSHPDLGYIQDLKIIPRDGENPNWKGILELAGFGEYGKPAPSTVPPDWAFEVVRTTQSKFDLV